MKAYFGISNANDTGEPDPVLTIFLEIQDNGIVKPPDQYFRDEPLTLLWMT